MNSDAYHSWYYYITDHLGSTRMVVTSTNTIKETINYYRCELRYEAEGITRSPQFLREIILNGRKKGLTSQQIARKAGLSIDEVELILAQNAGSDR